MLSDLKRIINARAESDQELIKLGRALGIKIDQIDYKSQFNKELDYCILNMGEDGSGGTHWVATDNIDKLYFDPLALPPPRIIPHDYREAPIRVQRYEYGHCGVYCLLWLYYAQRDEEDEYFKLFKALPDLI